MAESRNHLFFECPYSWNVWTEIAAKCNLSPNQSWDQILLDLQALRCCRPQKLLSILACQCVIYLLWTERNNRLHRQIFRPPDSVTSSVSGTIRSKIAALRDQPPRLSSSMFAIWLAWRSLPQIISWSKLCMSLPLSKSLQETTENYHLGLRAFTYLSFNYAVWFHT